MNVHPAGPRHAGEIQYGGLPPRPQTAADMLALAPNIGPRNLSRGSDGVVAVAGGAAPLRQRRSGRGGVEGPGALGLSAHFPTAHFPTRRPRAS